MRVALLVPRRADHGRRDQLWEFCREWFAREGWTIVEAHDDGTGPFNRAALLNQAARDADPWDVGVILDADVVADPAQLTRAVTTAHETGRMTLAYDRYVALNQAMTDRILDGYSGNWEPGVKLRMTTHVSSLVAVPAALWAEVGGFDDRFHGWGHEDVAFADSCRTLGGGIERVPGTVWHLHHPPSPEVNTRSPLYRASRALADRYHKALLPQDMRRIVTERATPDGVLVVVLTNGRRDCIAATIPSAETNLHGLPVVRRVISDDSDDREYQAWLRVQFPEWELIVTPAKQGGFAANVLNAWNAALRSGQRWIFWLEDDFTFNRPVPLDAMARALSTNRHLLQMALRRQAWFPGELAAGGVVEQHPDGYVDRCDGPHGWLEHQLFWTTNPHLVERRTLIAHEWPQRPHSESVFARQVLTGDHRAGYWGPRHEPPWVQHIGVERVGHTY